MFSDPKTWVPHIVQQFNNNSTTIGKHVSESVFRMFSNVFGPPSPSRSAHHRHHHRPWKLVNSVNGGKLPKIGRVKNLAASQLRPLRQQFKSARHVCHHLRRSLVARSAVFWRTVARGAGCRMVCRWSALMASKYGNRIRATFPLVHMSTTSLDFDIAVVWCCKLSMGRACIASIIVGDMWSEKIATCMHTRYRHIYIYTQMSG